MERGYCILKPHEKVHFSVVVAFSQKHVGKWNKENLLSNAY
jgi:hypothetical protein